MKAGSFADIVKLVLKSPREASLLGVAALILISATGFSFYLTNRVLRDIRTADELNAYDTKLTEFVRLLRTVESSQRGYVITADRDFLVPYDEKRGLLLPLAEDLHRSAPPDLNIAGKVAAILDPLAAKLQEMEEVVSLVKEGRHDSAVAIVKNGLGRDLMLRIDDDVHAIHDESKEKIKKNEEGTLRLQHIKFIIDGVGTLLVISFSFLSLWLLLRSNDALRETQGVLACTNADLEDTVMQRTAALKRANDEVQRFVYIVSHDLRSPLVNIMGFTAELETLRTELFEKLAAANALSGSEVLNKDFDEAFGFIKSSIERMDRLIAAILKISRDGSRPINPERIDMNALVNGVISGNKHQIKEKEAQVEVLNLPGIVTDRLAMEQIFSNLVENAVKFLKPGEKGHIKIEGALSGENTIYRVSDNGRGVDPKDHQRIFELFRRAGPQDVPGEGMGLAYVSALMRRLGGTITVESAVGRGSTFQLTLPTKAAVQTRITAA